MANKYKFTKKKRDQFLKDLSDTANVSTAAKMTGIGRASWYRYRDRDEDFARAWDEAYETAVDALEAEARRRALEGVDEPVYYKGVPSGYIRKYSDTLLIFLLKGARPEKYRENVAAQVGGDVNVTFRWKNDGDSDPV